MTKLRTLAIEAGAIPANDNKAKPATAFLNTMKQLADSPIPLKDRFELTWFDDIEESPVKEEIVEGLIGAGEFSAWVAKPGTGKSVLLTDVGCHIAAGRDWNGRKVKQGLVIFLAAERKELTKNRIAAWRKHHGVTGLPFVVASGKLEPSSPMM